MRQTDEHYMCEAINADSRYHMKRFARKSRFLSRQVQAFKKHLRLFVFCYKQRQIVKRRFPKYFAYSID